MHDPDRRVAQVDEANTALKVAGDDPTVGPCTIQLVRYGASSSKVPHSEGNEVKSEETSHDKCEEITKSDDEEHYKK